MRVFLTGGAGFIGSACMVAMLERGWQVVCVDNFEETLYDRERKEYNLAWAREHGDFHFEEIDIRDAEALARVLDEQGPFDLVLHLAAVAGVRPSIPKAAYYFDINVTATASLLALARARGTERFVLASSSSVYGGNEKVPFAETDPVDSPVSPYAASKRSMELLCSTDVSLHGGQLSCLRFFTVYGPRQRPEMAIHKFMRRIDEGHTLPMFGDGTSGRDYTYIDDIVQGVMAAIDHQPSGYSVFNLGGDQVILLRELIDAIAEVVGEPAQIEQLPDQPGDVPMTNADLTHSRQAIGYDPQTSLRDGLQKMWDWYQREGRELSPDQQ